jgi:HEPN domain-containing protein
MKSSYEIEFEKTHVLEDLISLASQKDNTFLELIEFAKKLTSYAVEIRYSLIEESTEEEAKEAIELSLKIKEFILERLSLRSEEKNI